MEAEARATADRMNDVLSDPIGKEFQRLYDDNGLQSMGLPTATSYSGPDASWQYQLSFQTGTVTITCPPLCLKPER